MQDFILSGQPLDKNNLSSDGDVALSERVTITDDDVFLYSSTADVLQNLDDIKAIVNYHEQFISPKYKVKRDYYKGRHHTIIEAPDKPLNKPDKRLIINLPKKLVNTFNGYFSGEPVTIKHQAKGIDDDALNDQIHGWLNDNDYADVFSEWTKQADIYGRSYLYLYQVDSELQMTVCSPRDTIVVYDDSVRHKPMFAIRYSTVANNQYDTLITKEADYELNDAGNSFSITNASDDNVDSVSKEYVHKFPELPVIELAEDDERTGIFDDVISLVDEVDTTQSEKGNDISSFADAYLVVTGQKLTPEQLNDLRDNRLINLYTNNSASFNTSVGIQPDVEFLTPGQNDTTQENALNRDIDMIYQTTQVVNLNDSSMGMSAQSISGVALIQRYQPMQAKAYTKSLKMDKALRLLFTILFDQWKVTAKVSDLTFDHKQSIPHNVSEEADIVTKLNGQVSDPTKLSYLSGIDDPQKEVDRLADQEKQQQETNAAPLQQFLTDQQKGGVGNGTDNESTTAKDKGTSPAGQPNGQGN